MAVLLFFLLLVVVMSCRLTLLSSSMPFSVVVGGGNDQSFPNACGLLSSLPESCHLCVINIDAHLDVRPLTVADQVSSMATFSFPFF